MFTGLIETQLIVLEILPLGEGLRMAFSLPSHSTLSLGESIAINGLCSTVIQIESDRFYVDYLKESCDKGTLRFFSVGQFVNSELCVTPSTRLGGHLVSGHIDTIGRVLSLVYEEPFYKVTIEYPTAFAPFLVEKGSVALDGISLTILDVTETSFSCCIIPHTFQNTVISSYTEGTFANLEFDMIGKYVHRSLSLRGESYE